MIDVSTVTRIDRDERRIFRFCLQSLVELVAECEDLARWLEERDLAYFESRSYAVHFRMQSKGVTVTAPDSQFAEALETARQTSKQRLTIRGLDDSSNFR